MRLSRDRLRLIGLCLRRLLGRFQGVDVPFELIELAKLGLDFVPLLFRQRDGARFAPGVRLSWQRDADHCHERDAGKR